MDDLAEDSRARWPRRRTTVLPTIIATASMRMVASGGPLIVVAPSPTDHIVVALRLASVAERSCTEGALRQSCTEGVLSCRDGAEAHFEVFPRRRDAELLACCTAAVSRRSRSSPWTHRPSKVEGSGIVRSSIAAAVTFWLARLKIGGCSPPSSLLMRWLTS